MKTITAKNLRDHLDEIVERVRHGETIRVTYRSRPAFRIEPDTSPGAAPEPGSPEAMQNFVQMMQAVNRSPRASSLDPHKPIKQLHHELLDADPKYRTPND
jgi:prevent-host-death family protein